MIANRSRTFLADFRDFIMRGNVVDLAVAVILGQGVFILQFSLPFFVSSFPLILDLKLNFNFFI